MLDGINSGWIHFGVPGTEPFTGTTELETVSPPARQRLIFTRLQFHASTRLTG